MNLLIILLLSSGSFLLLISLLPIRTIINHAGARGVENYWRLLFAMVCLFLCGYLAYTWLTWWNYASLIDLIVPVVFFFGSIFVLLVTTLSVKTAQTLQHTFQLERDNITDSLLNIYNRCHLEQRLPEQFASARRYGHDLAVMMIDIDHFKAVNDTWGHQAGDQVLQKVACLIKRSIREADILCRYGGEELFLMLPHTGGSAALNKAEQIRSNMEKAEIHSEPVTISIGVTALTAEIVSSDDLLWQADMALYRAKQEGRNRCVFFSPEQCCQVKP
ncbi:MAG: GGDEF domain-containing protein [Pelovirga sp.]